MTGPNELIIIVIIIVILSASGLWPSVLRGLRELRGERFDSEQPQANGPRRRNSLDEELCFRLLGISPSSTWEEIEKAYRKKAKLHHPDLGGDEDMMRALNEAYNQIKQLRGR